MKIRLLAAAVLAFVAPGAHARPPLQAPAGFLYFGDCEEQTVLLNYSASQFAGLLPPGFAFPGNGRRASVHVSGSSCAVGSEGRPSNELIAFVEVVPPVALQATGIEAYGIFLGAITESPATVAGFTTLGFGDRVELGMVEVSVKTLLGTRDGKTRAIGPRTRLTTTTVATGPLLKFPAAAARLFRVDNQVVTHAIEGRYTAQTAKVGTGTVLQAAGGFLPMPLPLGVGLASHTIGYDLSIEPVPLP